MKKPGIHKTDYLQIAKYYDQVRPDPENTWLSKIIEYGKIGAKCAILDVGCGTGRFPLSMSTIEGSMFCGLEPSTEMLKQAVAKDKARRVLWVGGDGQRIPFRDGFFDCVYMTLVIHHIENKTMALREIHRVLKKGGYCVIMTNSHSRIKKHVLSDFPEVIALDLQRFPSIPSLKNSMKTIGFTDVHHHILKHDRGYISTSEYLERVRNRYVSTLTLLSEEDFQEGFKIFQERVKRKHGSQIKQIDRFVFVTGQK